MTWVLFFVLFTPNEHGGHSPEEPWPRRYGEYEARHLCEIDAGIIENVGGGDGFAVAWCDPAGSPEEGT